jgi:hypothetical protein
MQTKVIDPLIRAGINFTRKKTFDLLRKAFIIVCLRKIQTGSE